ncbi:MULTISPECIES: DUF6192 family protein [unclassified Amycolatopsis]|uniref:DUF6192 family protein n=1 Tax=unclassified Amycolatopsis TaxID=2618356 RepID=UPI001C69F3D6|nr:DUF6192 family protein [Amycolatopsis sp. DSM 110486]QYN20143.1 hypothetical protein K1T34_47625 [Amycolatopsis sp. DSM 110486]
MSKRRYRPLAKRASKHLEDQAASQFALGDMALELEPMRSQSGGNGGVYEALQVFADDIGLEFRTLLDYRAVAAAWPQQRRSVKASWSVYQRMAYLPDRFKVIKDPPFNDRLGTRTWTVSAAERAANRAPHRRPEDKPEERAARVQELTRDEHVASAVAGQLLRRPEVAGRVMANPDTRRQLYRAQADHDRAAVGNRRIDAGR